jgi:putative peptidoglycan lipid II flippase
VFAQAVITAYYPAMGRCFARNDVDGLARVYADGARFVMLLTMGAAVLLALLAEPIVIVLLERGRFDVAASATTASVLFVLTLGLAFRGLAYFNYRVLHAALRPWLQVGIGLLGVATQIGLNLWWVDSLGIRGIALSLSLATLQSALLSSLAVQILLGRGAWRTFVGDLGRVILMAVVLWACARGLSHVLLGHGAEWPRLVFALATMAVCGLAAAVAIGVGVWLRQPDLLSLWQGARARWSRFARRGAEGA